MLYAWRITTTARTKEKNAMYLPSLDVSQQNFKNPPHLALILNEDQLQNGILKTPSKIH